jgi:hypothetical protein
MILKKIILLSSLVVPALQTSAQISVAPEIGANLSSVTVEHINPAQSEPAIGNIRKRSGLRIGVTVNVPVTKGFFVQSGIFAPLKGHEYSTFTFNPDYGLPEEHRITTNPVYVEIPLSIGYELRISKVSRIFFTAGAYGSYMVNSFTTKEDVLIQDFLLSGISAPSDIKRPDFGTVFSAGYKLGKRAFARLQYSLGLKNIAMDESFNIRKKSLSLTIGYAVAVK